MRFSSIEIKNYRQYRSLNLSFRKKDTDLQVIVGDNGTGKTNLLNAFTWCLYGEEPHLGKADEKKGEPKLNKGVARELADRGIRIEEVQVQIEIEADDDCIRVTRKVPFRIVSATELIEKKADETFSVVVISKDGKSKVVHPDAVPAYLNRFLPQSIREYFFFDGEQLNNYFSDRRVGVMEKAVHSISQIDYVTRMKERTSNVANNLMKKAKKDSPNLDGLTSDIQKKEKEMRAFEEGVSEDERDIVRLSEALDEIEESLRGLPEVDELERKRDALRSRRGALGENALEALEEYCVFARNRYIDFAFYEAAKGALESIKGMERDNQLPPAIDVGLLKSMLSEHMCKVCKRPLSEEEEKHIAALLELHRVGTETANILAGVRSELSYLVARVERYPKDRKAAMNRLDDAQRRLEENERALREVEEAYNRCPDPEKVKHWVAERKRLEEELENKRKSKVKRETYLMLYGNTIKKKRDEYERMKMKCGLGDAMQIAGDFGLRAARILEEVEKEAIAETREMIEGQTEQFFKELVWKDSKCDHIELDSSYRISLYDKHGFSCAATCSAAERALLALSFTLAMHSVSGFDSPLFIDTPIARASGDNRANFARTLAEVSRKKQIILTFTPDEYSESIAQVFDPIAASHLRLELDESEREVSMKGVQ